MYDTESAAASVAPGEPRPIESASASTACQTNDSKFAYVLTAGLLGLGCLFFIAIALLLYSVFSVSTTQKYALSDTYIIEPDGGWYGNGYDGDYYDGYLGGWNHI